MCILNSIGRMSHYTKIVLIQSMLILKGPNRYLFTYAIPICVKSFAPTNPASWKVATQCLILNPQLQFSILISQTPWVLRSNINYSAFRLALGLLPPGIVPETGLSGLPPFHLKYYICSYNLPSLHPQTPGEGNTSIFPSLLCLASFIRIPSSKLWEAWLEPWMRQSLLAGPEGS